MCFSAFFSKNRNFQHRWHVTLVFEEQGGGAPVNVAESKASRAAHLVFLQVRVIPEIQSERKVRQRIGEVGYLHLA